MLLGKFKIKGHSMEPFIRPENEVLVSSIPYFFSKPKIEDIVVFRYSNKVLIKRIKEINNSRFMLEGDNKSDSLRIGWIKKSDIIGKVIYKL